MWRFSKLYQPTNGIFCRYAADVWCNKPLATTLRLIKEHLKVDTQTLHHCTKRPPLSVNGYRKPRYLLYKLCFGVGTVWGVKTCAGSILASCHTSQTSRISGLKFEENFEVDPKFDWNKFFALLWPHIYYLLAAIAGALVVAVLNIEIPRLLGSVINVVAKFAQNGGSALFREQVKLPVFRLVFLYVSQACFTFMYIYILSCVGEKVATQLKQELFESIMKQDIAFFDRQRTGELVNRLTSDIQDFKSAFKLCISQGLRSIAQIIGCGASLFLISPQMTWTMLLIVPTVIVTGTVLGSMLRKLSRDAQAQAAKATSVGEEAISNVRTVRAFAMESQECELFRQQCDEASHLNQHLGFGIGLFQAGTNLFLNGMVLATLYLGGYLVSNRQVSPGDLMSFLVATQTIQRSLTQLSLLFGQMVKGLGAGARVFEFINLESSMPVTGGKKIPHHSLIGDVSFNDVTFAYPTRPQQVVLKNFNLHIPAGKTVAIVGSSGNGKSTVAALLERFYDVDEGSVTVSGVDIRELDPSWLRGNCIGFINQEPVLFASSVMENIRYGKPSASDSEVIEAAKLANADEFIQNFPEGYSTLVGERGVTVSGGQKQRIAIARALLKNPSILILDEATSALDAESEKIVQTSLDNVSKGRTVLVIAHRLSTVQNADMIVVLHNGVVVEMGTHDFLKVQRGFYWNLIRQQEMSENISRALG
ncbi:ATP-binding cassette sub-family B member 8, mitochondrial isoform X1 [Zootermopsis nevadensis]|uniref:Mitochondrial potassium channel ATP-binding subunit n=1 Tax=Zootermopsis nevadensis TaxID=136037 RepID=A0A067RAL4_ZOONE|nr:ATP-binding cassette sub-family B member 8, mitochondrial isoform X1 [Zootermopsis nevadensis]KDR20884.1 ATP-binding cassette sub-family B member 8, mitochondrial [Zootermopsis nevadensis]